MLWEITMLLLCVVEPVKAEEPAKELTPEEYKQGYEDAIDRIRVLQQKMYHNDRVMYIGKQWFDSLIQEVQQLRRENTAVNKQLQSVRDYLEREYHVYLSDITGKVYDETDSPLYREKVLRRIVEEKLRKERDDRDLDKAVYEARTSSLNKELYAIGRERDELRRRLDEAHRYFKSLQDAGVIEATGTSR